MKENLMNSEHKATNEAYRDNYDRIFGVKCPICKDEGRVSLRHGAWVTCECRFPNGHQTREEEYEY